MTASDDGFVSRWSRRKDQARSTEPKDKLGAPPQEPAGKAVPDSAPESAAPDEAIPEDLPDPDTLTADSDFTVFLKDGVPEELRQRALRRLWRSNPIFANLDGLNDYDLDYTNAATVVAGLKTLYQVGRGFVLDEDEGKNEDVKVKAPSDSTETVLGDIGEPAAEVEQAALENPDEQQEINTLDQTDNGDHSSKTRVAEVAGESGKAEAASRGARGDALRRRWGGA